MRSPLDHDAVDLHQHAASLENLRMYDLISREKLNVPINALSFTVLPPSYTCLVFGVSNLIDFLF